MSKQGNAWPTRPSSGGRRRSPSRCPRCTPSASATPPHPVGRGLPSAVGDRGRDARGVSDARGAGRSRPIGAHRRRRRVVPLPPTGFRRPSPAGPPRRRPNPRRGDPRSHRRDAPQERAARGPEAVVQLDRVGGRRAADRTRSLRRAAAHPITGGVGREPIAECRRWRASRRSLPADRRWEPSGRAPTSGLSTRANVREHGTLFDPRDPLHNTPCPPPRARAPRRIAGLAGAG